ncbi:hypothetical protein LTR17_005379 [Elasticomyces elasticus]|nr:hypothetical protein LTR17_005379 [Elasticomyces elasticus]
MSSSAKTAPLTPVKSSSKARQWSPPQAKTTDILMTLPAELRNNIYGMVFTDSSWVIIHPARQIRASNHGEIEPAWREPALLQVNKTIRNEASTMYYKSNDFNVEVNLAELPHACKRLGGIIERCGVSPFKSLRIVITYADWHTLPNGYHLGLLFYETGLQATPGADRTDGIGKSRRSRSGKEDHVLCCSRQMLSAALRAALEIGFVKAGARRRWRTGLVYG